MTAHGLVNGRGPQAESELMDGWTRSEQTDKTSVRRSGRDLVFHPAALPKSALTAIAKEAEGGPDEHGAEAAVEGSGNG
jgi:hypothetical protein